MAGVFPLFLFFICVHTFIETSQVFNLQLPGDPPISIVSYFVLPPNLRSNDNDEFAKVLAMFDRFVDIPLFDGTATSSTGKDSIKTPEVAPTSGATPPITSSTSSLVGGKSVEIFENYGAAVPIGTGEGKQADSSSNSAADIALTVSQESDRKENGSGDGGRSPFLMDQDWRTAVAAAGASHS